LVVDGRRIPAFAERGPANLPWGELGVDLVLECAGAFTIIGDLERHIEAASYVILSAPRRSEDVRTVVHGVNRSRSRQPAPSGRRSSTPPTALTRQRSWWDPAD
jgi:glyceraldehyde-3-phosphate dehydrogenase/erythrose-4-phosphate dehydrogenase